MAKQTDSNGVAEDGVTVVRLDRDRWDAIARAQSELIDILARGVLASIERSETGVDGRFTEERKDGLERREESDPGQIA